MSTLIILNQPPYGTEHDFNGLRLALALIKRDSDAPVNVFLMGDAVLCAKRGQQTPDGYYNIGRMLKRVTLAKGHVQACGTCLAARGIAEDELLVGTEIGTIDGLAEATEVAGRVLVF